LKASLLAAFFNVSGRRFQGSTTRTAKEYFLISHFLIAHNAYFHETLLVKSLAYIRIYFSVNCFIYFKI
jgi:hypothetical protein